jgi:hypothetical protein
MLFVKLVLFVLYTHKVLEEWVKGVSPAERKTECLLQLLYAPEEKSTRRSTCGRKRQGPQ